MNTCLYREAQFRQAAGTAFRPGGLSLTRVLAEACRLRPGERVLDVGCGVGSTAAYLSQEWEAVVCGLDSSLELLTEARLSHPELDWVLGKADAIPCGADEFDVVFAECVLSTIDAAAALAEIRRVLRPGGRLAVSDVYLRNPAAGPLCAASVASCLRGAAGKGATLDLLHKAGFDVWMWRDCSGSLKELTASLILAYGSAADFWKTCAGGIQDSVAIESFRAQVTKARPGYHLLVAGA